MNEILLPSPTYALRVSLIGQPVASRHAQLALPSIAGISACDFGLSHDAAV